MANIGGMCAELLGDSGLVSCGRVESEAGGWRQYAVVIRLEVIRGCY